MSGGLDGAPPHIGSQWIKANVVGAVINVVLTFVAFLIGQVLGVSEPDASTLLQAAFVVVATAALAFGLLVLGYLCGVVLRTKLPAFPMHAWLALYAVMGVIFGLVSAFAWLTPGTDDLDAGDTDALIVLAFGAAIAGAAISAVFGSLQALIVRPVAQGLGLWIGCCALAGVLFVLIVPAVFYGPQSGFASELMMEFVTLVVTILAAVILLPAVKGLTPR
jgi:hypothetical protein